jgi:hypothetical protein
MCVGERTSGCGRERTGAFVEYVSGDARGGNGSLGDTPPSAIKRSPKKGTDDVRNAYFVLSIQRHDPS